MNPATDSAAEDYRMADLLPHTGALVLLERVERVVCEDRAVIVGRARAGVDAANRASASLDCCVAGNSSVFGDGMRVMALGTVEAGAVSGLSCFSAICRDGAWDIGTFSDAVVSFSACPSRTTCADGCCDCCE